MALTTEPLAPPAFPLDAPPVSKRLKSITNFLDEPFTEIFSAVVRSICDWPSIKCSNRFTNTDMTSPVNIKTAKDR